LTSCTVASALKQLEPLELELLELPEEGDLDTTGAEDKTGAEDTTGADEPAGVTQTKLKEVEPEFWHTRGLAPAGKGRRENCSDVNVPCDGSHVKDLYTFTIIPVELQDVYLP